MEIVEVSPFTVISRVDENEQSELTVYLPDTAGEAHDSISSSANKPLAWA